MPKENPFKVGEPVPDEYHLVRFYVSSFFEWIDFYTYIQCDREIPDESEANRLFEAYKKYINNAEQQPKP